MGMDNVVVLQKPKPMWELYTDAELRPGALQHGLSIAAERERIRLFHIGFKRWPQSLQKYVIGNGRLITPADTNLLVIEWLKLPMPPDAA